MGVASLSCVKWVTRFALVAHTLWVLHWFQQHGNNYRVEPPMSDRMRVLAGSVAVGEYITTNKPTDRWWKVEAIANERRGTSQTLVYRFTVVNKAGYRKEITADPGTGRKLYRWIPPNRRVV